MVCPSRQPLARLATLPAARWSARDPAALAATSGTGPAASAPGAYCHNDIVDKTFLGVLLRWSSHRQALQQLQTIPKVLSQSAVMRSSSLVVMLRQLQCATCSSAPWVNTLPSACCRQHAHCRVIDLTRVHALHQSSSEPSHNVSNGNTNHTQCNANMPALR